MIQQYGQIAIPTLLKDGERTDIEPRFTTTALNDLRARLSRLVGAPARSLSFIFTDAGKPENDLLLTQQFKDTEDNIFLIPLTMKGQCRVRSEAPGETQHIVLQTGFVIGLDRRFDLNIDCLPSPDGCMFIQAVQTRG